MDRERDPLKVEDLKFDDAGLIPAVIQQHDTGEVLMVAWMNADSLAKTLETKRTWFWSRSRSKYWMKGEESGNVQEVLDVAYDCDADCLLVKVDQVGSGVACHTGERSCFYRSLLNPEPAPSPLGAPATGSAPDLGAVLAGLYDVLEQRKREMPEDSYTAKLLLGHEDKLLKKIGEEATEVVMAAKDGSAEQLRYEIADLVYHMMVVMVRHGLTPGDLAAELDGRRR